MPNSTNPASANPGGTPVAPQTPVQSQTISQLADTASRLQAIISSTGDIAIYRAANDEYSACQDRISTLLNLKLAGDSIGMQQAAFPMAAAKAALEAVLQSISKAADLINGVAQFLGVVDSVITAAKLAASEL